MNSRDIKPGMHLCNIVPPFGKRRQLCRLEITGGRVGNRWQAYCHYTDRNYILRAASIVKRLADPVTVPDERPHGEHPHLGLCGCDQCEAYDAAERQEY